MKTMRDNLVGQEVPIILYKKKLSELKVRWICERERERERGGGERESSLMS